MENKQSQKAGDNSQQIQVNTVNMYNGIDEKRAREIFDEKFLMSKQDYTQEAIAIANSRVKDFEDKLIPKISKINDGLSIFADPSFQFLLVEAQKAAASTERIEDYDLLSELLVHRVNNGSDRNKRAGISRAVEIVENISDEALLGLTVMHCLGYFTPTSGNIDDGLNALDKLFEKIIYGVLPIGDEWLDHLDILDSVRINSFGNMKTVQEIYSTTLEGYVAVGIKKDSEEHKKAIEILNEVGLSHSIILVEHKLNSDYMRIDVPSKKTINTLHLNRSTIINNIKLTIPVPYTDLQKEAVKSVYELYQDDATIKEQNIQEFIKKWDERSSLNMLRKWWDNMPSLSISITSVGKVLAHANAQRCDNSLPPLN